MAKPEHWNIDPYDEGEMWTRLIGKDREDRAETEQQVQRIFGRRTGFRCLEVGAGVGRLLKHAHNNFYDAVGVDSSPSIVAASTRYLQGMPWARVILANSTRLPFPQNHFEFAYSFTCFQHMEDLETIVLSLRELHRVLRPNGKILIQNVYTGGALPEEGLFDGYVFTTIPEYVQEFHLAGFTGVTVSLEQPWIWVEATKG